MLFFKRVLKSHGNLSRSGKTITKSFFSAFVYIWIYDKKFQYVKGFLQANKWTNSAVF